MRFFCILLSLFILTQSYSQQSAETIRLNQIGFFPLAQKIAVVTDADANEFNILNDKKEIVYTGLLGKKTMWPQAGEKCQIADFSTFTIPGTYTIQVNNYPESFPFTIETNTFYEVNNAIIKAFYLNRASIEILPQYAGKYARKLGHPDDKAIILPQAAGPVRKAGEIIPASKGWYDAGDYNKYIVNSGISTATLLLAYENYSSYFDTLTWNIPESKNSLPDILDEAKWNLDWMLTMQDPDDGGVYNKTTDEKFSGMIMPDKATTTRYVVGKSTAAALDFAATMALSYRVFKKIDSTYANECLKAAEKAWDWAQTHPNIPFKNPEAEGKYPKINTGGYGDKNFKDEQLWAASELFIATKNTEKYLTHIDLTPTIEIPAWFNVGGMSLYSLYNYRNEIKDFIPTEKIIQKIIEKAHILQTYQENENAYRVPVVDYSWGSNGVLANQGILFLYAYNITHKIEYFNAALSAYDYILGRNATEYSFITEYGEKNPKNIHHRPSEGDKIEGSIPGFLAGGPNGGFKKDCFGNYSPFAAKAYYDGVCSFTTNEIAINWQAPMVYLAHGLTAEYKNNTITQNQVYIQSMQDEIVCKRTDSIIILSIISNTIWKATTKATWLSVPDKSFSNNSKITINIIEQNESEFEREATIYLLIHDVIISEIKVVQAGRPKKFRLEAESFVHMRNVQTEQTLDIGGGLDVGWIDYNDFMLYSVDIPKTGTYALNYRVSAVDSTGELVLKNLDKEFSHISIPPTGAWQNWTTIQDTVKLTEGIHEIMLYARKGGFNINFIDFEFVKE